MMVMSELSNIDKRIKLTTMMISELSQSQEDDFEDAYLL